MDTLIFIFRQEQILYEFKFIDTSTLTYQNKFGIYPGSGSFRPWYGPYLVRGVSGETCVQRGGRWTPSERLVDRIT